MRPMQTTKSAERLDDEYESETMPDLGFNGTVKTISHFLRRLFGRPTPSH